MCGREVSYQAFSQAVDFYFFFNREKHKVLNYISFLGCSFWDKIGFTNDFSSTASDTLQKVPGAIETGAVENNKRLGGEAQGSGKKKKRAVNQKEIEGRKMLEKGG